MPDGDDDKNANYATPDVNDDNNAMPDVNDDNNATPDVNDDMNPNYATPDVNDDKQTMPEYDVLQSMVSAASLEAKRSLIEARVASARQLEAVRDELREVS